MDLIGVAIAGAAVTGQNAQSARVGEVTSFIFAVFASQVVQTILATALTLYIRDSFGIALLLKIPIWMYFAGILAPPTIVIITLTMSTLGVGTATSLMLCFEMVASVIFDTFGLLGFKQRALSKLRLSGAVLSIIAIAIITYKPKAEATKLDEILSKPRLSKQRYILMCLLSAGSGVALALTSAMMGAFAARTSPSFSSFISTAIAMVVMIMAYIYEMVFLKPKYTLKSAWRDTPWWVKFSGLSNFYYGVMICYVLPRIGGSLFFGIANAMQILSALACDFIVTRRLTAFQIVGAIMLTSGTTLISLY